MKQTRVKLKNGITLIHYHLPATSSVTLSAMFNVGATAESPAEFGMAHYVEHMLFDGSKQYPNPPRTHRLIETLGIVENAWTSKNLTTYYMKIPPQSVPKAVDILFDRLNNPLFTTDAFHKENGIIVEEIKMGLDEPGSVAWEELCENLFAQTALAHPVIGYIKTVKNFTPEMLKSFYRRHYHTKNMILCAAGNMPTEELIPILEKYHAPKPPVSRNSHITYPSKIKDQVSFTKMDVGMDTIMLAINGFPFDSAQIDSVFVASAIFGLGQGSILNNELRVKRSLVPYLDVELYPLNQDGILLISLISPAHNTAEALTRTFSSFRSLVEGDFPLRDLTRAKNMILSSLQRFSETSSSLSESSGYFNLPSREMITGKEIDFDILIERISSLTREEVTGALRKALKGKQFYASIAGADDNSQQIVQNVLHKVIHT